MEDSIDFRQFLKVLIQRFFLIISFVIIAGGLAAVISTLIMKPIYEAQTQLLINENSSSGEIDPSESFERDLQLINTYNIIIKSPAVLDVVIQELGLDYNLDTLVNKISVTNEENSKVVHIKVEDENPEIAVQIANMIAEVAKVEIPTLMSIDNINILTPAKMSDNPTPVKPNILLNIVIGLFVGLLIGVVLAFLLETLDSTIKGEQHVEEFLHLPVLGMISSIPKEMDINYSQQKLEKSRRGISGIQKEME